MDISVGDHPTAAATSWGSPRRHWPATVVERILAHHPRPLPEQRRLLAIEALSVSVPPLASSGYLMVGTILATLTEETWENLLRREVFAPLQMSSAGFGVPRAISPAQPQGHRMADDDGGKEEPGPVWVVDDIDNPAVMGPAGTVHATLADLARFATEHLPFLLLTATTTTPLRPCGVL